MFVDIGVGESSMIHVSRLATQYVNDPHQLFAVGDTLDVWVLDIDKDRRRVNLTAIKPGTEKPAPRQKRDKSPRSRTSGNDSGETSHQSGAKPPRRSKKPFAKKGQGNRGNTRRNRPSQPKKPAKPITKEMIEGKEPMRTFGDLAQLFELDKKPDDKRKKDDSK